ncbi:hypothetical protein B0H10DRAFT_1946819 [Mycena sp. CBHHK59/15]|nr:hypothetical protein B0H10DRAFT_1946819 [Mycena sp. CBHHK59/15]
MSHIALDPALETCPDYSSAAFLFLRTALVAQTAGLSDADAAAQMVTAWNTDLDTRKAAWATQVQADADAETAVIAAAAAQSDLECLACEAKEAAERKEADKKKPKLPAFDEDQSVPDYLPPRPSNYAKHKLEQFEYCELWYFTIEGCKDADSARTTQADNAFSLTQTDGGLVLQPLSTARASKPRPMQAAGWSEGHRTALATFFYALDAHPYRSRKNSEQALIIYQARVRRNWHDTLKNGRGYNIGNLNAKLLEDIFNEYHGDLQSEKLLAVCHLFLIAQ